MSETSIPSERSIPEQTGTRSWRSSTWVVLGFVLAFGVGLALWALAANWESYGWALVLGVPLAIGALCGYTGHGKRGLALLVVFFVGLGLAVSAATLHISGLLCATVLLTISIVPMLVGVLAGFALRRMSEERRVASVLIPVLLIVLPVPGLWVEGRLGPPPRGTVEVVRTSRVVALDPQEAWGRIVFYEEVPARPPALARIGLPRPLYTEGSAGAVGDLKRCVYSSGYLIKRITEHAPPRRLTFEVLEQHGVEDRSVELIDGGFELEPAGDGATRITLETRYRPLLQARLFWRPFEHRLAHVLHNHVLDGIAEDMGDDAADEVR